MRRGTSRRVASRRVAYFFKIHTGKASSVILVKMASQQPDMLLALTLQNQVIALIVLQKQRKATILVSRSLETTKTAKSSLQFKLRNELQDYTMCFNYLRILPSTFDEWVRLVRPFVVSKGSISFLFFPTSVIKARQFFH